MSLRVHLNKTHCLIYMLIKVGGQRSSQRRLRKLPPSSKHSLFALQKKLKTFSLTFHINMTEQSFLPASIFNSVFTVDGGVNARFPLTSHIIISNGVTFHRLLYKHHLFLRLQKVFVPRVVCLEMLINIRELCWNNSWAGVQCLALCS